MEPLHARYPFLAAAREAVQAAEVDLGDLVTAGGPPVERGRERVERALLEGTVASREGWGTRAELLSYPVARVLVSLLDVPGAVEKYAEAEARVAGERFVEDVERDAELRSDRTPRITLRQLLDDFDLAGDVRAVVGEGQGPPDAAPGRYDVAVTAYLRLAADQAGDDWRLATRELADGAVPVERRELYALLRAAVRERVADGLPLDVPDPVAVALDDQVTALREAVADVDPPRSFDAAVPGLFPPCVQALLDRARDGEDLPAHSRFSLVAFLTSVGLDADEVLTICAVGAEGAEAWRAQVERVRDDDGAQYAPPSCETMVAYGDCVNRDATCETIAHPLSYYGTRLESAEEPTDWREA